MPNTKAQKFKDFLGHVLEPFALGVLALLFIIPTITVMNLSPITKKLKELNVLGATTQSTVSVDLVGGTHDIFTSENLTKTSDNVYEYTTTLNKGNADRYSKPILQIQNNTESVQKVSFYGGTQDAIKSKIGMTVGDTQTYTLQDTSGQTYQQEISLDPSEKVTIFLFIEGFNNTQFSEDFSMQVKVVQNN